MNVANKLNPTKSPLVVKISDPVEPGRYEGILKEVLFREAKVDENGNEWAARLQFVFLLVSGKEVSKYTGVMVSQKSGLRAFLRMLILPGEISETAEKDPEVLWSFMQGLIGRHYFVDVDWNPKRTWTYATSVLLIGKESRAA
jgi:hypothetical protein